MNVHNFVRFRLVSRKQRWHLLSISRGLHLRVFFATARNRRLSTASGPFSSSSFRVSVDAPIRAAFIHSRGEKTASREQAPAALFFASRAFRPRRRKSPNNDDDAARYPSATWTRLRRSPVDREARKTKCQTSPKRGDDLSVSRIKVVSDANSRFSVIGFDKFCLRRCLGTSVHA